MKTVDNHNGEINIQKIDTNKQLADIMAKGLVKAKFAPLQDELMGWNLCKSELFHLRESIRNVSSYATTAGHCVDIV